MIYRTSVVALSALMCAVTAHGELSVTVDYDGEGRGSYQSVQVKSSFDWDDATQSQYYYLNSTEHLWTGLDGESYITHCIEVYAGIPDGETTFKVVDIEDAPQDAWPGEMGDIRATVLESLFAVWVDPNTGGVFDQGSASDSDDLAAAFQLMTWEITHENFEATSAVQMVAQLIDMRRLSYAIETAGEYFEAPLLPSKYGRPHPSKPMLTALGNNPPPPGSYSNNASAQPQQTTRPRRSMDRRAVCCRRRRAQGPETCGRAFECAEQGGWGSG